MEELIGLAYFEPFLEINSVSGEKSKGEIPHLAYHPLLAPKILEQVFTKLKNADLAQCRLVCQTWRNEVTICPSKEFNVILNHRRSLSNFVDLMSLPSAKFPSHHVVLEEDNFDLNSPNSISLNHPEFLGLLETFGDSIRSLALNSSNNFQYLPLLMLPLVCKQLTTLGVQVKSNESCFSDFLYVPKQFEEIWKNPFPFLKSFMLNVKDRSEYDTMGNDNCTAKIVVQILKKSPKITSLSLTDVDQQALAYIAKELSSLPGFIPQLTSLRVDGHQEFFTPLTPIRLNLTYLHIPSLGILETSTFSQILQATCNTLEYLKITADYRPNTEDVLDFVVEFKCEMKRLSCIEIEDVISIRAGSEGLPGLFSLLPVLTHFEFVSEEIDELLSDVDRDQFWTGLFPNKATGAGDGLSCYSHNKHLKKLWICTPLNDVTVVGHIQKRFPSLCSLMLEIHANILPEIIRKLKDLPIVKFTVRYLEKEDGDVVSFSSALTGIEMDRVDQFLKLDDKEGAFEEEGNKIGDSLGDWKNLRKLEISYKAKSNGNVLLNRIVICQGFLKQVKLEKLRLRHFEVEERYVIKTLKKLPLKHLSFTSCLIKPLKTFRSRVDDETSIALRMKDRFPEVNFKYSLDN